MKRGYGKALVILITLLCSAPVLRAGEEVLDGSCPGAPESLREVMIRIIENDRARNLDGVLSNYTEDVVWLPSNAEVVMGKAAIRPRYEKLFSGFAITLSLEIAEVRSDGGLGFVRGYTTGTLVPVSGGDPVAVNDKFLALMRCEEGTWRVSHLMWSPRN